MIEFQQTSLKGFERILQLSSLEEILKQRKGAERKYKYPTPYVDVRLEEDHRNAYGPDCDLTFWAVQFKDFAANT